MDHIDSPTGVLPGEHRRDPRGEVFASNVHDGSQRFGDATLLILRRRASAGRVGNEQDDAGGSPNVMRRSSRPTGRSAPRSPVQPPPKCQQHTQDRSTAKRLIQDEYC